MSHCLWANHCHHLSPDRQLNSTALSRVLAPQCPMVSFCWWAICFQHLSQPKHFLQTLHTILPLNWPDRGLISSHKVANWDILQGYLRIREAKSFFCVIRLFHFPPEIMLQHSLMLIANLLSCKRQTVKHSWEHARVWSHRLLGRFCGFPEDGNACFSSAFS